MGNLIHGKQLRPNTLKENLLLISGASATEGQILAYDSSNGGFAWVNDSSGVNVTGGTASYVDEAGTLTFTSSDASTFQVTGVDNDFVTGMTFNNGTYDLSVTRNDGTVYTQNLGILGTDINVTGGTYDIDTGVVTFTTNSGGTFGVTGFTSGMTDSYTTTATTAGNVITFDNNILGAGLYSVDLTDMLTSGDSFVTGGTINYVDEAGTVTYTLNDATTFQVNGFTDIRTTGGTYATGSITFTQNDGTTYSVTGLDSTDTFVTGGTYDNSIAAITFTNNDAATFAVDMSTLDLNDTYLSSGTATGGTIELTLNDASTVNVTGGIINTVTGDSPITASTTSGAVTVGIDYASLQLAVQTSDDKDQLVTGTTVGNASPTGVIIANTPVNGGYVKVEINGVGYAVGDNTLNSDCYFSVDGGANARAIADITSGDQLFWNGANVTFDIEANVDRVDFFYEVLA